MGRKNKTYSKSLKQQAREKLETMLKNGEGQSKKEAIANGTERDKIFSYNTYDTYRKHCDYFVDYVRKEHPECTTLRSARKYANEWLEKRQNQVNKKGEHLSAWTIQTEAKALGKLYGITPDDPNYFKAPQRHRQDIKRSRGDAVRDNHFSKTNNDEFIKFCQGTGCRRSIVGKLEGRDLFTKDEMVEKMVAYYRQGNLTENEKKDMVNIVDAIGNFPDQEYFIHHRQDKGGRSRYSPIVGKNADRIIERMKDTPEREKVWQHVPTNADIHGYRGDYATTIYKAYARPIDEIPYDKVKGKTGIRYQSEVYVCRKDEAGKKLDKAAMLKASKALGHNRLEVVANNYIRGL